VSLWARSKCVIRCGSSARKYIKRGRGHYLASLGVISDSAIRQVLKANMIYSSGGNDLARNF
jgi:hypothetical protein